MSLSRLVFTPRGPLWLAGVLFCSMLSGCGAGGSVSDPDEGRTLLVKMLDTWKAGSPADSLSKQEPAIQVTDGDWISGLRLVSYNIEDPGKLVGTDLNFNVALELKTPKGQVTKRNAVYIVTTRPLRLIVRQDSL